MRKMSKFAYSAAFVVLVWSMVGVTRSTPKLEQVQQANAGLPK